MFTNETETNEMVTKVLDRVYDTVVSTMGTNGRLVAINQGTASPKVTKDGVTVARTIKFKDPAQELINRIITEPAIKTDLECGDGTTTTIFLTKHLKTLFDIFPGFSDRRLIKTMIGQVINHLEEQAIKVTSDSPLLLKLAMTSSNQDERIANLIVSLFKQAGERFPEIELKPNSEIDDKVVKVDGVVLRVSYADPVFSPTHNGAEGSFDSFRVMVVDNNINQITQEEANALVKLLQEHNSDILIIARTVSHDAINSVLRINQHVNNGYQIRMFKTGFGGGLGSLVAQDIAGIFDVPSMKSLEGSLSMTESLTVRENATLIVDSRRSILSDYDDVVETRIKNMVKAIRSETDKYMVDMRNSPQARFNESRIRNLESSVITLYVGGETTSDISERIDRYEDVVKACKSALVQGILPGQGVALMRAAEHLKELYSNVEPLEVNWVLVEVIDLLLEQRRHLTEDVMKVSQIEDSNLIFNLATGELEDVDSTSVYDTAYASIVALKGGLSTAEILSSLSSVILGDKLGAVRIGSQSN